jgi:peptidoglycan/LPS O-acetylase OafA/YrhL
VSAQTGRYDYLDGLRAVAIAAVLALHWLAWYSPFFHGGSIGVDVFFVLSGFIITSMLWRSGGQGTLLGGWWSFIRRRVVRLYPALLGLVLFSVVLYGVAPFAPLEPAEVLRRGVIVLGQGSATFAAGHHGSLWLPSLHPFGQTWSLAIEWYFYLLWPVVVLTARARGWSARRCATWSLTAAALLYAGSLPLGTFWFYFGPSARSAELLAGGALALLLQAGPVSARSPWFVSAISIASLGALAAYSLLAPSASSPAYRLVGVPVTVLATTVLIYAGYTGSVGPVHRLLSHPWMAGTGRYSYSLYLWHLVPFLLLEDASPSLPRPVLGLLTVLATAVLTLASYRFLERPFLRPRSDVLSPAQLAPSTAGTRVDSTPNDSSAPIRSSAAWRVGFNPMRTTTSARQAAPSRPFASRSARKLPKG